jgi:hypothetical protein
LIRFIVNSFIFKKAILITSIFVIIFIGASITFDYLWRPESFVILKNLNLVYMPPPAYDNITKINLKLEDFNKVTIEGNKKFKLCGSNKQSDYYDTIFLKFPELQSECLNKYFLKFDSSQFNDSLYIVVSKSTKENIYWKQIFLSSVFIEKLNSFSNNSDFKIENKQLLEQSILENNDSLIQLVYKYFNENANSLGLGNCGRNSDVFKSICEKYNVPCRMLSLQGGDALYAGLDKTLGYPYHAICEVYSSKIKKWFVVDPSYGVTYSDERELQNAIEISKALFFNKINGISQDSVLVTKSSILDRDYFKYYENIYYESNYHPNKVTRKILRLLYKKFEPGLYQYSSNISNIKDGYYYVGLKTILFLMILVLHFNIIMYLVIKRLIMAKRKPNIIKHDRKYSSAR